MDRLDTYMGASLSSKGLYFYPFLPDMYTDLHPFCFKRRKNPVRFAILFILNTADPIDFERIGP